MEKGDRGAYGIKSKPEVTPSVNWILLSLMGALGLCLGSFTNVIIYRVPQGQSILSPGSRCPSCAAVLTWYDRIPVVSFLWLRGRCRYCGLGIPWHYPVVEAIVGAGSVWVFAVLSGRPGAAMPWAALRGMVLLGLLVAASFIDVFHRKIPNRLVAYGLLAAATLESVQFLGVHLITVATHAPMAGFLVDAKLGSGEIDTLHLTAGLLESFDETLVYPAWIRALSVLLTQGVLSRLAGFLLLGGVMFLIAIAARGGMGGGDVKLAAMIGAYTGLTAGATGLVLAFLTGAIAGLILIVFKKGGGKTPIPFAPFLAFGGFIGFVYGDTLFAWYVSRMVLAGGP